MVVIQTNKERECMKAATSWLAVSPTKRGPLVRIPKEIYNLV
jgi:hypothetical protein